MTQKPKLSDLSKRFIETARELGCDEDGAAFDEKAEADCDGKTEIYYAQPQIACAGK
jgi:hypothetical protein